MTISRHASPGRRPVNNQRHHSVCVTAERELAVPTSIRWPSPRFASGRVGSATLGHDALLKARLERLQQTNEGRIPMRMLAISSGGIKGNYGTSVLIGWGESGKRPELDVVTGVPVGVLMAPFVFLGSDYDEQLNASGVQAVTIPSADEARPEQEPRGCTRRTGGGD